MTDKSTPDLAGLCAELAVGLDGVSSANEGEAIAWSRGAAVFARVTDAVLEVRLPADIAEAALRTPDTALDPADRGWVRFSPADAERHVTDRATAWFQTAWRHAADN